MTLKKKTDSEKQDSGIFTTILEHNTFPVLWDCAVKWFRLSRLVPLEITVKLPQIENCESIPSQNADGKKGHEHVSCVFICQRKFSNVSFTKHASESKAKFLSLSHHWFACRLDGPAGGAHSRHFAGILVMKSGFWSEGRDWEGLVWPWWWLFSSTHLSWRMGASASQWVAGGNIFSRAVPHGHLQRQRPSQCLFNAKHEVDESRK